MPGWSCAGWRRLDRLPKMRVEMVPSSMSTKVPQRPRDAARDESRAHRMAGRSPDRAATARPSCRQRAAGARRGGSRGGARAVPWPRRDHPAPAPAAGSLSPGTAVAMAQRSVHSGRRGSSRRPPAHRPGSTRRAGARWRRERRRRTPRHGTSRYRPVPGTRASAARRGNGARKDGPGQAPKVVRRLGPELQPLGQ